MKISLKQYIAFLENKLLQKNKKINKENLLNFHLVQISFFQHERLIHLLITLFFGFIFFLSILIQFIIKTDLIIIFFCFSLLNIILWILLIFYIFHYFILENWVQKLYKLYEEIIKLKK